MNEPFHLWWELAPSQALRLASAVLCGVLLGLERESRDKPAGLRTIVLITVGSTLFMIVGELVALVTQGPPSITRPDPTRIGAQVVSGVGFLGAGTIIQSRGTVHGLTTAATIWVAAAIGLCLGVGFLVTGLVTTLLVLMVLVVLDPIAEKQRLRGEWRELTFTTERDSLVEELVGLLLLEHGIKES